MKLEVLKDNKTTKARVGSIIIVSNHMGAQWIEKGWAKDLSNPIQEKVVIGARIGGGYDGKGRGLSEQNWRADEGAE